MKDQRFIELVNLYIDRQITVSEAAELEDEIQGNPGRRAIYRQYCQMHQATRQVYDSFRAPATAAPELAQTANRNAIARFENQQRQPRFRWAYFAGGLAAACLALVFVRLNTQPTTAAGLMASLDKRSPAKLVGTCCSIKKGLFTSRLASFGRNSCVSRLSTSAVRSVAKVDFIKNLSLCACSERISRSNAKPSAKSIRATRLHSVRRPLHKGDGR